LLGVVNKVELDVFWSRLLVFLFPFLQLLSSFVLQVSDLDVGDFVIQIIHLAAVELADVATIRR